MKQLLQCYKNEATIVAFHERLFVFYVKNQSVVELIMPPPVDVFVKEESKKQQNKDKKKQQQHQKQQQEGVSNPIQAVAIVAEEVDGETTERVFWCAVSRADKSLLLYRIQTNAFKTNDATTNTTTTTTDEENDQTKIQTIESPTTIYNTTKRVGCMCFARVPHKDNNTGGMLVLLVGDYTGDAFAWPLKQPQHDTKEEKADSSAIEETSSSCSKLLLGHTASMLTGIRYDPTNHLLLTSDRDEKIRVSSFPQTTIIKGFLLGHEAYVSCMDHVVVNNNSNSVSSNKSSKLSSRSLCVTCSGGDGTVRVWKYGTTARMNELVCWSANNTNNNAEKVESDTKNYDQEATNDATASEDNKNADDNVNNVNDKIPARVAIDSKGQYIAVVYDNCQTLDILKLQQQQEGEEDEADNVNDNDGTKTSLELAQSIECPDQPLNVCFTAAGDDCNSSNSSLMVLMKDSTYLQVYGQQQEDNDDDGNTNKTTTSAVLFESIELPPGLLALQQFAQQNKIRLPDSVIDKDSKGAPKMQKIVEKNGAAMAAEQDKPWNKTERIEIAKERNRRHRKHRAERKRKERQEKQQQKQQQQEKQLEDKEEDIQHPRQHKKQKVNGSSE